MSKKTVRASSDIALVKYWGKKDEVLRLPENGSISMVLDSLHTTTTVEFSEAYNQDELTINGHADELELQRVTKHLDRIRKLGKSTLSAKVVSENNFPKSTGLSSSGSGFAALTIAASSALSLSISEKESSILARQGSGTACRCVCGGFVEWKDGETSDDSYSSTILSATEWEIHDVVAIIGDSKKYLSSSEGHESASSSIFFETRQKRIAKKLSDVKSALLENDFLKMGELVESECYEFHSILFTSQPTILMWYPGTIEILQKVRELRSQGIPAYATINTGYNVHVLTLPKYSEQVSAELLALPAVQKTILAKPGGKPIFLDSHLF